MKVRDTVRAVSGIFRLGQRMDREMGSCIGPDAISAGQSGPFDARSLSCWLTIAELAGVATVPAKPIVVVSAEVIDRLVSGTATDADLAEVDRMAEAMEGLPSGWMVRHDHVGSEDLKIVAAMGKFPEDGDAGVGWARWNNRILPRFWDSRIFKAMAQSLVDRQVFLARPWIAARTRTGEDPHRAGTELAGQGTWPREWRAFVMDGRIVGVSNYYIQAPAAGDDEDQAAVRAVTEAAQAIVDEAAARHLTPHDPMILQIQRVSREVRRRLPVGGIHGSLDFVEAEDGRLLFLEGGPAYTPAPFRYGAHPCAFLGQEWPEGVAYALEEGVHPLGIGGPEVPQRQP